MPIELVFARQERPVGLSTLEQVRALQEQARDAATTAATDAVEAAGPVIEQRTQEAADAAVAAAQSQIAAERQAAQDAATAAASAASTAATDAAAQVAPAAADAIRAQVAADADRAETAAETAGGFLQNALNQANAAATSAENARAVLQDEVADRGDSLVLARVNGQTVVLLDDRGRIDARAAPGLASSVLAGVTPADADILASRSQIIQSLELGGTFDRGDVVQLAKINDVPIIVIHPAGYVDLRLGSESLQDLYSRLGLDTLFDPPVPGLDRGDAIEAATINDRSILAVLPSGQVDLRLSQDAVDDIGQRLDLDSLQVASAPLAADLAGDVDAWDVWQRGGLTFFTGMVWGNYPRGYVRRGAGDIWAVSPRAMRLKLVYGDHIANALPSVAPTRFAHIATLGDAFEQSGANGAAMTENAVDLVRAGQGFGAVAADAELSLKTGALPRYGVRSEAVEGATLEELATGQPLANLIRARDQFSAMAALYEGLAAPWTVSLLHAGGATDATVYRDALLALVAKISESISPDLVNVFAPSGTWADGSDPAILGAVEALRARGSMGMALVSPLHWCGVRQGTLGTPDAVSMTMLAELDAHATRAGTGWHGPIPFRCERSGSTVFVDFEVMAGHSLVAPTYGVRYSGAAITGMSVVAHPLTLRMTRLKVDLAADAAGTLSIAFGATGTNQAQFANRCDLRDDWGAPSVTGQTLRRFTHSCNISVS